MKSTQPRDTFHKSANFYKILANAKRLEVLALLKKGEVSVEKLIDSTRLSKANLSQHLGLLRRTGIVQTRREGLHIFYRIADECVIDLI